MEKNYASYVEMAEPIYSQLEKAVRETYKNACIIYIQRNENKHLEADFEKYKSQFDDPNVKTLFHGTSANNAGNIMLDGFDPALKKVCAYGNGVYFSTRAAYSRRYSKTHNKDDLAFMLLCDVVCGKVAQGSSGSNIPRGYQSFTDNITRPDMYIVDKREAAYPRYLVAFYPYAK
jgi:hypothetical protein